MVVGTLALVAWLAVDVPMDLVRTERPTAVWFEPQLRFHAFGSGRADVFGSDMSALPFGLEAGHQLGRAAFVSVAVARLPISDGGQSLVSVGGRWYLARSLISPYAIATVGVTHEDRDEGHDPTTNPFAMIGPGVEAAWRNGICLTTDFQIGPENLADGPSRSWSSSWHLSGFYRVGLGYRF
jgi:hypothetical protein